MFSWNYDRQFEYSVSQFDTQDPSDFLQVIPHKKKEINFDQFFLLKLNGTIGSLVENDNTLDIKINYDHFKEKMNREDENCIVTNILKRFELYHSALSESHNNGSINIPTHYSIYFSWENSNYDDIKYEASKAFSKCQILVIIGYSFPTFNRSIDKGLLKRLMPSKLTKVYIQSPVKTIEGVTHRFKSLLKEDLRRVTVEPITNLDEFHIPFEF